MVSANRRVLLRDAGVALGLFVVLLALLRVPFPPVQIPGYLLTLSFDAIQNPLAPGLGGGAFQVAFGAYVVGLAAVGGLLASRLRRRFGPAGRWRYGLAGGVLAVAVVSLAVLVLVLVRNFTGNLSPLLIAGLVGLGGLWLGWRIAASRPPADGL